jgi:hypothetical protein
VAALQVHVHPMLSILRERMVSTMIANETEGFSPIYSSWVGKPVVMLVVIRQCHVPMPCRIVGESAADVRVRIHPGWELDVRKDLILAVEEVVIVAEDRVN